MEKRDSVDTMDTLKGSITETHSNSGLYQQSDMSNWAWNEDNKLINRDGYLEKSHLPEDRYAYRNQNLNLNENDINDDGYSGAAKYGTNEDGGSFNSRRNYQYDTINKFSQQHFKQRADDSNMSQNVYAAIQSEDKRNKPPPFLSENSHKTSEYSLGSNSKINNANNPFTDQSAREENSPIQQHSFTHIVQGSGSQSHISNPALLDQLKSSTVAPQQRHHQDRSAIEGADSFPTPTNIAALTTDENINMQEKITYRMSVEGASRTSSTTDGKSTTSLQQQQLQQPPFDQWYKNSLQTNDGGCWQQPSSFDSERDDLPNTAHNNSSYPNSVTSEGLSNRFKDVPSSKEPVPQKSNYAVDPTSNYRTVNNEFRRETNIVNSNSPSGSADSKLFSSQNQYYDQQNQLVMPAINNNSSYERNHLASVDNLILPPPPSSANNTYERNQPPRGPSSLHEVGYNDGTSKSAFHKATNSQRTHAGKQAVPAVDENQFCVVDNSRVPISRVDSRLNFEKIPQFSNERAVVPGAQRNNSNEINNIYASSSTPILDERSRQSVSPDNRTRKLSKQFSMDQQPYSSNESPPIELQRIVLGETGSNSPPPTLRKQDIKEPSQLSTVHSDETAKHSVNSVKEKESYPSQRSERGHHNRREYNSKRRRHRRMDSDEEDYDVGDRRYDSPDRSSHSHRPKESSRYGTGPRKPEPSRRDRENSFTQSQDESFYDEDDYEDDYDSGHYKYYSRRPPKDNRHRHYNYDSFYRDERRNYRDRRRDMYNSRIEEDPYYNERPSRPSSRSDSDYRRDTQEYYYSMPRYYGRQPHYEMQDINYSMFYGQFDIQKSTHMKELLHFRERDPKGYAAWYKWYLSTRKRTESFTTSSNTVAAAIPAATASLMTMNSYHSNERRGSGHLSGQSSVNEEVLGRSKDKLLDSYPDESVKSDIASIQEQRDSPLKFNVPHIKGVFNGLGQLIVINPPHAQNGEPNIVDIYQFTVPENETELKELLNLPGPFIVGETHVNTVSDYLKYKANSATARNSEKLLYLLVYLIIKLRGRVDGIAVSELLMENYEQFSYNADIRSSSNDLLTSLPSEIDGTNDTDNSKFMQQYVQLLIQGNKINALELAINNKQWGHAFSLAYKMDMKYFSSVLTLFDNSVSNNSPLTTLYQLLSGRLPQSIEHFAREKCNDWRPHLAMILSNTTGNVDLARHAVETLGNSLANQNDIHAAHFCYLTMELNYGSECLSKSKYNLLSLTNGQINRLTYVKLIPAIMLTQAYEFAVQLQHKQFVIPSLMIYKLLLVQTLVTYNRYNAAYQYLEQIGTVMSQNSALYSHELAQHVINLAERIKHHVTDHATIVKDSLQSDQWLSALQSQFVASMKINDSDPFNKEGSLPPQQIPSTVNQPSSSDQLKMESQHQPQFYQPHLYPVPLQSYPPSDTYKQNVPEQTSHYPQSSEIQYGQEPSRTISDINNTPVYPNQIRNSNAVHNFTDNNNGGNFSNYNTSTENSSPTENSANTLSSDSTDPNYYAPWNQQYAQPISISTKSNYDYFENADLEDHRVSSDNTMAASLSNTENVQHSNENRESSTASNKINGSGKDKKLELADNNSGGGWLGGFFEKLSLRPKNQMKLPDDRKKTIKWSEEKNRWINVGDDGDEDTGDNFKPPPKASELNNFVSDAMNRLPPNSTSGLTGAANSDPAKTIPTGDASSSFNVYKMSKGRGMKANYVNVLSQNVNSSNSQLPAPSLNAFSTPPMLNMKMFAPSLPATNNELKKDNFSGPPSIGDSTQGAVNHQGPIFYNPSQYKSS